MRNLVTRLTAVCVLAAMALPLKAQTATAPASSPASAPSGAFRFQYSDMPLVSVVRDLAHFGGRTLIGDVSVDGSLTFSDTDEYSFEEALDMLNTFLEPRGQYIRHDGKFLRLDKLADSVRSARTLVDMKLAAEEGVRTGEIITVVLPLKTVPPQEAVKALAKLASSWGQIVPLTKGKGIVVTDRLDRIQGMQAFIRLIDDEAMSERQLRVHTLKKANAADVARIIDELFGPRALALRTTGGIVGGRGMESLRFDPSDSVIATHDAPSNTVFVQGLGDKLAMAEEMITTLESIASDTLDAGTKIFQLQHTKADELARTISAALPNAQPAPAVRRTMRRPAPALAPAPANQAARVVADIPGNRLIVSADAEQMAVIENMIRELDSESVTRGGMRILRLKNAQAMEIASVVTQASMRIEPSGRRVQTVVVSADPKSNSLILRGASDDADLAAKLVEELDAAAGEGESTREIHVVHLEAGNARDLAQSLMRLFVQTPTRRGQAPSPDALRVEAQNATNSLIISSRPEDWPVVKDILDKLQTSSAKTAGSTRLVQLKAASAADVVMSLRPICDAQNRQRRGDQNAVPIVIAPSPSGKSLIVSAADEDQAMMQELIDGLDVESADTSPIRTVYLQAADPDMVVQKLRGMLPPPQRGQKSDVFVQADRLTRCVWVRAPLEEWQTIEKMILQLDEASRQWVREMRSLPLEHVPADAMAATLSQHYQNFVAARGRRIDAAEQIILTPAPGGKVLLVEAPMARIEEIATLTKTLDKAEFAEEMEIRTVHLQNAVAQTLARSLNDTLKTRGGPQNVTVSAETNSNSILIRAPKAQLEALQAMVLELDERSTVGGVRVKTYVLENAQASEIVKSVGKFFQEAIQSPARQRPGSSVPPFAITADDRTNTLMVTTTAGHFEMIDQLVSRLDDAQHRPQATMQYYQLSSANAAEVWNTLTQVFSSRRAADRPVVELDEYSNAITVIARDEDLQMIAAMIAKREEVAVHSDRQIRVIPLSKTRADRVAEAIVRLYQPMTESKVELTGQSPFNPVETGDGLFKMFPGGADVNLVPFMEAAVAAASAPTSQPANRQKVSIAVDRSANALIVAGSRQDLANIESLVAKLSTSMASAEAEFRVFNLKQADASVVAQTLQDLFNPTARIQVQQSPQAARGGQGAAGQRQSPAQARQQITVPPPSISVVAHPATKSIIVRAKPSDFDMIEPIIQHLDQRATVVSEVRVFALTNTDAAETANNLKELFGLSSGQTPQRNSRTARQMQPNQAELIRQMMEIEGPEGTTRQIDFSTIVSVSANRQTNSVVVAAPADVMELVARIITELDETSRIAQYPVYVIPLQNSRASDVARMIQTLYQPLAAAASRDRRAVDPLSVSADDRANVVVLATSRQMYEQVRQWVDEVERIKPSHGKVRIITVEHADPAEVQRAIDQLYGGGGGSVAPASTGRGSRSAAGSAAPSTGRIPVTVLANQKSVMATVSDEEFETIMQLVRAMEEAAAKGRRQVRVFVVKNTTSARIAAALNQAYAPARGARAQADVTVSVTALAQTNAIVASGPQDKLDEIAILIEQLDREEIAPELEFRVVHLENAQPTKILPSLRQMIEQMRKLRPGEAIDVQAEERTRSIIITARGQVFEQIEKIIAALDKPAEYESAEVLILPLKKADATRLAAVLNEMLRPAASGQVMPEARALQEQLRLLRINGGIDGGIPELDLSKPIKIAADAASPQGSNSLVITSTAENLKAMKAVVELLDVVPVATNVGVRVLRLKHADATSAAGILRDVFSQGQRLAGKQGTSVAGKGEPEGAAGKGLVNPLNVAPDLRTNTLIMSGGQESLALAEVILKDLDREEGQFVTDVKLFRLKNAHAARLAPVLQAVFAEGQAAPGMEGLRTQVSRLRTLADPLAAQETALPRSRQALVIRADESTNILIVAARSDVMPLIADVITTMDVPGAGSLNTVRICPLINADATRLAGVVSALFAGPNAKFVRDEDRPTVTVDTRTNALIISASENTFAMLDVLLKRLDEKGDIALRDIRLLALQNADAATLGATLQKMMDSRVQRLSSLGQQDAEALRVIVIADARSNSLIVGGSAEGYQIVKDLASQLDGASAALSGQIQLIPLKEGNAGSIAVTLTNLFNQRYQSARTTDVARQRPIILADVRTNSLLVAAGQDDSRVLESLLEKLDVAITNPSVQLVVLPLNYNDAGTIAPMIRTIFQARLTSMTIPGQAAAPQDRVDVASDSLSNSLIISASKENLSLIKGLLEKVDVEPPAKTGIVRMYSLKNTDAQRLATMLQGLLAGGLYKPGLVAGGSNAAVAAQEKVSLAVDPRTNVLIVSASRENFAVLEEIIEKLDSSEGNSVLGNIEVHSLRNADAVALAPILQQFYNAKRAAEVTAGDTGKSLPVTVFADARTNSLLVAGSAESFASVKAMIEKLDAADVLPAGAFKVFRLRHATASTLATMMTRLFDQRVTRGQQRQGVTIVADGQANTLTIGAAAEDMRIAEVLIEQLDAPARDGAATYVYPLQHANAVKVANTLRNLFQMQTQGSQGAMISVDERINAVVVVAGESDAKRIEDIVRQLDGETVAHVTEIRVFTLKNADAAEMAAILTEVLTRTPTAPAASNTPNRQAMIQFIRTEKGQQLVASALQEGVLITPDRRTNSLVVSAPVASMPLLDNLIRGLDSTSARAAEIRVFALKNADARQMADLLTQLFRLTGPANLAQAVQYTLVSSQPAQEAGASATLGSAEQTALTVTVDVRTNSLLIGGTSQYVELCCRVIEELDSSPAQERQTQVYRLHNARATDIQSALRTFLDQERQRLTASLGNDRLGAAQRLLEHEVAVVAVPAEGVIDRGNTLLISASPRYFEIVRSIIKELDEPPPQVLVQVLLAEVTLDNSTDLGIEWNYIHDKNNHSGTVGTNFGVAKDFLSYGGFHVSFTSSDISLFLRALQSTGRLEV
ncbi:MAG: hypothetical protein GXY38_13525, partial [Planctomycetes bacterium]|nr:hypothetical protein [Planctomycetota bacterium]